MKVINVQGRKKTGKTTTVTNIIAELCKRGYSVGSIKGIHIEGFTMDVSGEDTDKHKKAGANPVTARCHDETNIMFTSRLDFSEIIEHYSTDWVVIESHVDLHCPNIITGRTCTYDGQGNNVSLEEQINDQTICCSGVVSNDVSEFNGLPVINSVTDVERLVDLIEARTDVFTLKTDYKQESGKSLIEDSGYYKITADGDISKNTDCMLIESNIDISINGKFRGSVPYTPQYTNELVIGWMLYEGYISNIGDVDSITVNEEGTLAEVLLKPLIKCRRDGVSMIPVKPIMWDREWIFKLAKEFESNLPLRESTMAAHNCRIAIINGDNEIETLFVCEDIGRHSAIDKVIGWCLENEIDMSKCVLFTSGRISVAMTKKVIRAGIPVMAGKGTISKKAVELAANYDLALIGYAKRDSLCVFSGREYLKQ